MTIPKETADSIRSQYPQKSVRQIAKELGLPRSEVREVLFPETVPDPNKGERSAQRPAPSFLSPLKVFFLLLGGVFLVYSSSFPNDFVWDDMGLIVSNPAIQSVRHAASLFLHPIGEGTFSYRPLQILFYAIENRLWGMHPLGFHLASVFLHGVASFLVFIFFERMTKNASLSLAAAALFAVHPLHTGAVAYLSGQDNMMALVFILLCLIMHQSSGSGFSVRCLFSFAAFALGLLSKEVAMFTLPAIVLYDVLVTKKRWVDVFGRPFFYVYALLFCAYLVLRQRATASVIDEPLDHFVSWQNILLITPAVLLTYLKLFFWPHPLYLAHYFAAPKGFFDPPVFLSFAALTALFIGAWKVAGKSLWIAFGLSWFILWFLPFSNLFRLLNALLAEHWMYVPSVGFIFAATYAGDRFLPSAKAKNVIFFIFLFVFSALTFRQNFFWKNEEVLFTYTVKYAPRSARIWNNLGVVHEKKGETAEARACFEKAAQLMPGFVDAEENYKRLGGTVTRA